MLKNFLAKINLFAKAKVFIAANPKRTKFIVIILILLAVPLTIAAALTVQDLRQQASQNGGLEILDRNGNLIRETYDPIVYLKITLPSDWVVLSASPQTNNSLISKAYAVSSSCTPPYSGYLGCFSAGAIPSGSVCTGSCTTAEGQGGQYCYTSTKVGQTCTADSGSLGTCNNQGDCIASALPTPTPTPTPSPSPKPSPTATPIPQIATPTPLSYAQQGELCSPGRTDCAAGLTCTNIDINGYGRCSTPPTPTSSVRRNADYPTPTPTPAIHILDTIYVPDYMGRGAYSMPAGVWTNWGVTPKGQPFSIGLEKLQPTENPALRRFTVTLIAVDGFRTDLSATVILKRAPRTITSGPSVFTSGPSVFNSGVSVFAPRSISPKQLLDSLPGTTETALRTLDLNGNGMIDDDEAKAFEEHFGETGRNLPYDFNRDGIVDGVDYNILLRIRTAMR